MPLYDIQCSDCGLIEDVICPSEERNTCPECLKPAKMKPIMPRSAGIIWANAEQSNQLGRTFHTNKEKRDWLKAHPNVSEITTGSTEDRHMRANLQDRADKAVQKKGFKDMTHWNVEAKKHKASTENLTKPPINK